MAAPAPPPPALPKAPTTAAIAAPRQPSNVFTPDLHVQRPTYLTATMDAPPSTVDTGPVGVPSSTGDLETFPTVQPPPDPPPAPTTKKATPKTLHVSHMEPPQLIRKIQAAYPPIARATHIQGVVEFTAMISKNGDIEHLQLVRGHPILVKAAEEAILQWKYKPTILNGEAVEVITNILVNFTLSQ